MNERGGQSIGVFDSGIGGLSVLRALRAEMPHEDFIYIADSGHGPYGERDTAHVLARSRAIVHYLVSQNIKALVMACNTATAAAIHWLRAEHPGMELIGVEPALKPAVALSNTRRIGVFATRSTLCSAKFQALLASHAAQADFVMQPCDGLAHAIERSAQTGDTSETIALCARYISAAGIFGTKNGQIDTLVLGCTHYPLASEQLRALTGPSVRLIDNGEAVARQTRRRLSACLTAANAPPGRVSLLTTGDPQLLQSATRRWLDLSTSVDLLFI
ncbi:glutamate racemase [Polaromonas sp. CG_23.6]|uniref:glutamate racemase n=1 Tax=unclassified Polaromonas TaxID=2638319 RepID=UPI001A1B4A36|nr:glutamate racemase [Polaromonas sp. CG_23.6]MBG6070598.1 glutamate racemase [Polaromonas sp. CG_9.7]MBG6112596.1 glutamate racemase [Polaromonas sp. CG_9.2]MDH6184247.1 glutamate racemase [Polaromonas sp. CG_23.6]